MKGANMFDPSPKRTNQTKKNEQKKHEKGKPLQDDKIE